MMVHAILAQFQAALRSLQTGDRKDAAAGFDCVLRQAPHDARAWHFLGVALLQLNETQKGIDAIRRAIALDATKAAYHNNLGAGLLTLGDLDEARQAFERAAALDPQYADAVANLGLVHARLGLPEKAAGFFQEALRLKPGHVDALFNLGNLLFEQGRNDEAIERYRRAVKWPRRLATCSTSTR